MAQRGASRSTASASASHWCCSTADPWSADHDPPPAGYEVFLVKRARNRGWLAPTGCARCQDLGVNVDADPSPVALRRRQGLQVGGALAAMLSAASISSSPVKFRSPSSSSSPSRQRDHGRPVLARCCSRGRCRAKYHVPSIGAFIIYAVMVVMLIVVQGVARGRAMIGPEPVGYRGETTASS